MIPAKMNRCLGVAVISVLTSFCGFAQPGNKEQIPYYININQADVSITHAISDNQLHLEYYDAYGTEKEFIFRMYDWKRSLVATLKMDKSFGHNSYSIDLNEVYSGWELNKTYSGETKDEAGNVYKLPIRLIPPPKKDDPYVNIMVNPMEVGCTEFSQSLVEFYGDVQGGKAPYTVKWFVLNKSRTDFLYQPKEEVVNQEGKASVIRVDKNPEYYVVFYVKDACGNEQKRIVNLVCEKKKKKINTLFVEELTSPLFKKNPIQ
jgi:hypothetical protein